MTLRDARRQNQALGGSVKPVTPLQRKLAAEPVTENQVDGRRAFRSLAGQDEFSAGGKKRKPLLDLKPRRREVPALREGEKPLEVVDSAFVRKMGKILKGK